MTKEVIQEALGALDCGATIAPGSPIHKRLRAAIAPPAAPIDTVLHCPSCGKQHIDRPETAAAYAARVEAAIARDYTAETGTNGPSPRWMNPPHHTHRCTACGHKWRPARGPTNGVRATLSTKSSDKPATGRRG